MIRKNQINISIKKKREISMMNAISGLIETYENVAHKHTNIMSQFYCILQAWDTVKIAKKD